MDAVIDDTWGSWALEVITGHVRACRHSADSRIPTRRREQPGHPSASLPTNARFPLTLSPQPALDGSVIGGATWYSMQLGKATRVEASSISSERRLPEAQKGQIWMLTLYAKNVSENIPTHVLKKIWEEVDGQN